MTEKLNLTNEVTVFLIHGDNNPNYVDTFNALQNQTVEFTFIRIHNISPMSKAFQEMIDTCTTPYYVQVDEDMVLNENAIELLYNSIIESKPKHAFIYYNLHDVHLDFNIAGIKIYKHCIMKKYPYNLNSMSCEVSQIDKMKIDGYTFLGYSEVIGLHSPLWTEETIFERYFNLMEKEQIFKYAWMTNLPNKLWNIIKTAPNRLNLMAFLGAYTSVLGYNKQIGEKTFNSYNKEELQKIKRYLTEE